MPTIDLVETENQFEVTVDLPGLKPEEVKVELKNGELWISGKRLEEKEEKGKTYHRVERRTGSFSRSVTLPCPVEEEDVDAQYKNGILTIRMPKTEEAKAHKITAKS